MHKIYFPIHLDGGNRGCEGIAKGTALILGEPKEKLLGLCMDVELDRRLGVDEYVTLVPTRPTSLKTKLINKRIRLRRIFGFYEDYIVEDQYTPFLKPASADDVMLSTGGDMMCYGNNQIITTNEMMHARGVKTVLWGCSMGPSNLTPEKEATLRHFSLIYARESLTYEFFKSLGLKNMVCLPDPAFVLEPEKAELPECFSRGDVIGLNLSNYTVGADTLDTAFGIEVIKFLDYILTKTDKHILLVPHVFWQGQDDRIISHLIAGQYSDYADRLSLLDSEKLNYQQIRYVISQCYCFIGGRTHAVISAYATCTPAIALGYSIKSKGIARDLQLPEELVVDCVNDIKPDCLIRSYQYLFENYDKVKFILCSLVPEYRKRPFEAKKLLCFN